MLHDMILREPAGVVELGLPSLPRAFDAEGYHVVVDLDLEKYFDRVNHDILMGQVAKRIGDKRVLKVFRAFLNGGVLENGLVSPSREGVPQGGPLSPLLSNIMLDNFDRELERRGHRFVRFADDVNVYVRRERAGHRVRNRATQFFSRRLKLKVNEEKSAVASALRRQFLGFRLLRHKVIKRRYCGAEHKTLQESDPKTDQPK